MLPVTLISGYLGAGKTTLVNQMLRQADGARIAVLVNEFGALPIDEDLIEARDDTLLSIAGGCICCSFGSDLAEALGQLASFDPRPDHIVIEASGVALPASVALTVDLVDGMQVEGICVLADGLNIQTMLRDEYIGDTIENQLSMADLVVLTKTDLCTPDHLDALEHQIAEQWPGKPLLRATQGNVPNSVLLGHFSDASERTPAPHADGLYDSVVLEFKAPCDAERIAAHLNDPALGIVRAKGYLQDTSGQIALVQLAGARSEVTFPKSPGRMGVICIGLKDRINRDALLRLPLGAALAGSSG